MRHFSLFVPVILLASLAVSCDKVEDQNAGQSLKISVTSENQLEATKATLYGGTTKPADAIGVVGYLGDEKFLDGTAAKNGDVWETDGKYFFNTSVTLGLFAYYPSDIAPTDTKTSLSLSSYTVPATAADQKDIMMGYVSKSLSKDNMTASVELKHALTSVTFKYGDVPTSSFAVTGITITGVYASGACAFSSAKEFTWSGQATGGSFTGSTAVSPAKDANLGDSATFTLIPQSSFKPSIKVDYTYNSEAKSTIYTPDKNISWEIGKTYTFVISFNQVTLTVTAVDFNGGSWYTHGSDNVNTGNFTGENW